MNLQQRIHTFVRLKELLDYDIHNQPLAFTQLLAKATAQNPWFTQDNSLQALKAIAAMLSKDNLTAWLQPYTIAERQAKTVALILAGNIPLVGFHDLLCVLITGHSVQIKLSSKDAVLMAYIIDSLIYIDPSYAQRITIETSIVKNFDAIIATGSNNSARYFEHYFSKYPHIIRKNRNSIAIVHTNDTPNTLQRIGNDVFSYFGLGCRSVSKLYIPRSIEPAEILHAFEDFSSVATHSKYMNNYDYNKSIYLLSNIHHYDNGFLLLKQDAALYSPLAVLNYEYYDTESALAAQLQSMVHEIQCVVSTKDMYIKKAVVPGAAQQPMLNDYADDIDTIKFLLEI